MASGSLRCLLSGLRIFVGDIVDKDIYREYR